MADTAPTAFLYVAAIAVLRRQDVLPASMNRERFARQSLPAKLGPRCRPMPAQGIKIR